MQDVMVGDEAKQRYRELNVSYPIAKNGIVRNWDDMKLLWDYTFGETKLNIDPKNCKVSNILIECTLITHDSSKNL